MEYIIGILLLVTFVGLAVYAVRGSGSGDCPGSEENGAEELEVQDLPGQGSEDQRR